MKPSQLIVLTIISISVFYTLVGNPKVVTEIYLITILPALLYGFIKKDPNIIHISIFLILINLSEYIIFGYEIISLEAIDINKVVHGILIYGIQMLISLTAVAIFIFRVQISRKISKSEKVDLTYFDGIFHWIFLYTSLVYLAAMIEYTLRNVFDLPSLILVYNNNETLIYLAWALTCGTLLSMVVHSIRSEIKVKVQ
ncbi:hypothetical protein [Pseudoalteromonas sp. Of7M-16]|uniref:hypothetical protein n=1 Tax=Pseudoalteromonas sp. Of7M-16 TaxID=2917756 RepID=UPI001EF4D071|nr:hypothetical protein [Pseudoalteromonas sp. Of7M-16]MCG7546637.1 hypothetical protein [Pseudoalteromonas sp. Of7M-16]